MNSSVAPVPDAEVLTAQLFRYAQDMEELMRQHNRLQPQHYLASALQFRLEMVGSVPSLQGTVCRLLT